MAAFNWLNSLRIRRLACFAPLLFMACTQTGEPGRADEAHVGIATSALANGNVTLVPWRSSAWHFLDDGSNAGTTWRGASFADNGWPKGAAPLGYGGIGEVTTVSFGPNAAQKYVTTYFRKWFDVSSRTDFTALTLKLRGGDGAVAYLNGTEVLRRNLPTGTVTSSTAASSAPSDADPGAFSSASIAPALLVAGANVLAIEVHEGTASSSDLLIDTELTGTRNAPAGQTSYVSAGSNWRYKDDGSNQGTAWRATAFVDSAWKSGSAQLGYGDGDEGTSVLYGPNANAKYPTTYFRRTFSVANLAACTGLTLRLLRDDGAVVYLNGAEVVRSNMPSGTIGYQTFASSALSSPAEGAFVETTLACNKLVSGLNSLAVEVHQDSGTSSDLSFDAELVGAALALPEAPSLSASVVSSTAFDLTWNDAQSNETNFAVERAVVGSAFSVVATLPANTTVFHDTGRDPALIYDYRVSVSNAGGSSPPSNTVRTSLLQAGNATGEPVLVDEPMGPSTRHSIGLTLWHLAHDAARISQFQSYVAGRGYTQAQLFPNAVAPSSSYRLLVEPELLSGLPTSTGTIDLGCGNALPASWYSDGTSISSGSGDQGPSVSFPISVARAGLYRLWVQYRATVANAYATTAIRIYPKGQEQQPPILYDEIYDKPAGAAGPQWKDLLVDLGSGDYTVTLSHFPLAWQILPGGAAQYDLRKIDKLYLTDEIWTDTPPSDPDQQAVRTGGQHVSDVQWTSVHALTASEQSSWLQSLLRPSTWEQQGQNQRLFDLSYDFWRQKVDEAAASDYVAFGLPLPDYRLPQRQIVFDERWNLLANPVLIKRQSTWLQGNVVADPQLHYRIFGGDFNMGGAWYKDGEWLRATYLDFSGQASGALTVSRTATYHVWARIRNVNYYEPYRVTVSSPHGTPLIFNRSERLYLPISGDDTVWVHLGTIAANSNDALGFVVEPLGYVNPGTYRGIHSFEVTTDPNYAPTYAPAGAPPTPSTYAHYRLYAGKFDNVQAPWTRVGEWLTGTYYDFSSQATHSLPMEVGDNYYVWARISNIGYSEPYQLSVSSAGSAPVTFKRSLLSYPADVGNTAWVRLLDASGAFKPVTVAPGGTLDFSIQALTYNQVGLSSATGTTKGIHAFEITTDPNFVPQGPAENPIGTHDYLSRAAHVGGDPSRGFMAWVPISVYEPLSQYSSWPTASSPNTQYSLTIPRDSYASVPIHLRSLVTTPLNVQVLSGPLGSYSNRVEWRVTAFAPQSQGNGDWSPFVLLRRPDLTLPPTNVAGVWLTVRTQGMPTGDYTANVTLRARGYADQSVQLNVHIGATAITPQNPILASGWTQPPEGSVYTDDFVLHGLNIWQGVMNKDEMQRRKIRLLQLQSWCKDATSIGPLLERLSAAGVTAADFLVSVADEPSGHNATELAPYIDIANAIHALKPDAQVVFNPGETNPAFGEAGALATFTTLSPYAQWWIPYGQHVHQEPSVLSFLSQKPYFWYTTPVYWDKAPTLPQGLYDQFRAVPTMPGLIRGTSFFAFNYPFRDHWDTAYEWLPDVGVTVLPSRNGPVATRTWEAVREGIQHANLAQMVKERSPGEPLIATGTVEQLLSWLATH